VCVCGCGCVCVCVCVCVSGGETWQSLLNTAVNFSRFAKEEAISFLKDGR